MNTNQGYPASWVANSIIKWHKDQNKKGLTHLKLQKLVYCVHGWHLAINDKPAVDTRFGVWEYGPVNEGLYHQFKHYGNSEIDSYATTGFLGNDESLAYFVDDEGLNALIDAVLEKYSPLTGGQLSDLTHREGTPWSIAKKKNDPLLDNDEIENHYKALQK